MRPARHFPALLLAAGVLILAAYAGCGEEEEPATPPPEPVAARPADFPPAEGKDRQDLTRGLIEGPVFAPSTSVLNVGDNRFGFALFDAARKQVEASAVAIYTSRRDGSDLQGPYTARRESFAVKSPYRSAQAAGDLANGDAFYVSQPEVRDRRQPRPDRAGPDGRAPRRGRGGGDAGARRGRAAEDRRRRDRHAHAHAGRRGRRSREADHAHPAGQGHGEHRSGRRPWAKAGASCCSRRRGCAPRRSAAP